MPHDPLDLRIRRLETNPSFSEYNDPEKAKIIWDSYQEELLGRDLLIRGETILAECNDCDSLDARLNLLAEEARYNHAGVQNGNLDFYQPGEEIMDATAKSLDNL